jgi:hypothetical protein
MPAARRFDKGRSSRTVIGHPYRAKVRTPVS